MFVYLTENLINGKQYVGQTKKTDTDYFGSGLLMMRAIKKYGRKNFKRETLIECSSQEELDEQEIFWIQALNTLQPNGYNIENGGNGIDKISKKSKEKMSEAQKRIWKDPLERQKKINSHRGKKHSEKTKRKISESEKGKFVADKTKQKISKALTGRKLSEKHKINIGKTSEGRIPSTITKNKISNSVKKYWREK